MEGKSKEIIKRATHREAKTWKTKQSRGRRLRTEQKSVAMFNRTSKKSRGKEDDGTEAVPEDVKMSKNFPDLRKDQATELRCPKILYPAQASFKNEGKTMTLLDKEISICSQ